MTLARKQAGMSFIGWLILLLIFGGGVTVGLKLAPLYIDYNTMSEILDDMSKENGMGDKANLVIQQTVARRFDMNNIRDFDLKNNVTVHRTEKGVSVILDYKVTKPLLGNVALLVSFHKEVQLRT
ncbi:MAG TPA: DUF4845 domain-containing protein [Pseudomonadales bacterium]|nr:DUF4845 domain-containing protein [Pseudomonadales bacterium]